MVRAALVQFSGHESKEINVGKAEDLARQAAGNGAQIICFPELCTTIYFCFERDRKWFETAEPVPGPAVDRLARVARFSPYHFHRIFKALVGEGVNEYVRRLRLESAAVALKTT